MPLLNWYNRYTVNNEEIDNQHKKLFDIFNRLHDICVGKDKINTIGSVIDELVSYADYHFNSEEQYMRDTHYKCLNKQIDEHNYFKQKTKDLLNKNDRYDLTQCHELIVFLSNWLLKHVVEEDKKIVL